MHLNRKTPWLPRPTGVSLVQCPLGCTRPPETWNSPVDSDPEQKLVNHSRRGFRLFCLLFVCLPAGVRLLHSRLGAHAGQSRRCLVQGRAARPLCQKKKNKRAVQGVQEKVSIYRAGKPVIVPEFQVRVEINDERRRRTWRRRWGAWARQGLLAACSRLRNNQFWSKLEIKILKMEATFNIGKACEDW